MMQPSSEEKEAAVNVITVMTITLLHYLGNFPCQFNWNQFIRIHDEHPLIAEWQILQGPVFLFGIGPVKIKLDDFCPEFMGNLGSFIRALGIYQEYLVCPP
jgi:hypothetical protein